MLRHLIKIGVLAEETITEANYVFIRPCFEYANAAFHTTLTGGEQAEELERLQRQTLLKMIFGWDRSYLH